MEASARKQYAAALAFANRLRTRALWRVTPQSPKCAYYSRGHFVRHLMSIAFSVEVQLYIKFTNVPKNAEDSPEKIDVSRINMDIWLLLCR